MNQGTVKSLLKAQDTHKKSPSSSSGFTDQKSNVTKQNPKLNTVRESILSSTKQAFA